MCNHIVLDDEGITDKNQIQRYLRHIIIPKISGAGQKKLLETSVLVWGESIDSCDVLLSYAAAAGIGQIYLFLESYDKYEAVLTHVHDLNPEVNIELIKNMDQLKNQIQIDFNILVGNFDFINRMSNLIKRSASDEFLPTLISAAYGWQGCLGLCSNVESMQDFLAKLSKEQVCLNKISTEKYFYQLGMSMSYEFMGTLAVIELIKTRLNIGNIINDIVYFNLLETVFCNNMSQLDCKIEFNDQIKNKLSEARVLVIGTGGLGCPAALTLAKAGIGTIGLIDYDTVDLSNLNRQILHTTSKIGMKKVESAKEALKLINPEINIELYTAAFSLENAMEIIKKYHIIIDGLDNLPTRYLLNDACFFAKKPFIEAGVLAFYGQITTIIPENGPCYRCIFQKPSELNSAAGCSEVGVLGPVPGLMGILEAVEAIKMILGMDSRLKGGLLMYDALETDFNMVEFKRNKSCAICGDNPSIHELGEYTFVCKDKKSDE